MLFSGTDNHIAGLGAMVEWKDRLGGGMWDDKPGYECVSTPFSFPCLLAMC